MNISKSQLFIILTEELKGNDSFDYTTITRFTEWLKG